MPAGLVPAATSTLGMQCVRHRLSMHAVLKTLLRYLALQSLLLLVAPIQWGTEVVLAANALQSPSSTSLPGSHVWGTHRPKTLSSNQEQTLLLTFYTRHRCSSHSWSCKPWNVACISPCWLPPLICCSSAQGPRQLLVVLLQGCCLHS